jgi:hypothetical protein
MRKSKSLKEHFKKKLLSISQLSKHLIQNRQKNVPFIQLKNFHSRKERKISSKKKKILEKILSLEEKQKF